MLAVRAQLLNIIFRDTAINVLLDHTLERIDSSRMHTVYDNWPSMARAAFESDLKPIPYDKIDHIVFAGMGGSGAIGDVLASILSSTDMHVSTVKGYNIPRTVDSDTLVVATSISGNTAETLSVLSAALKQDCKIVALSSGGRIEQMSSRMEYRKIKYIHSPRASFAVFLYSMLKILYPILPIDARDVAESLDILELQKSKISSLNLSSDNPAMLLAKWLSGSVPLVYYPWGLQAAAIRFKNSMQENAKTHVIAEDVVEACHNGIVAWEKRSSVRPVILRGRDDDPKTKDRWDIVKEYFEKNNIEYRQVLSVTGGILSKIINLVYLLDYTSIYMAIQDGVDPSPVSSIDFVKERI